MIEPIMYVGIGFLVACMLVIGLIPFVHARAVRLTMRRLEAATPISMAEIQADKDQLRAEFAMSTRRLEMSVEQLKAKTTSQLAEIGKKSDFIGRLKLELGEKTASLFGLEAKEKQLAEELRDTRQDRDAKAAALDDDRAPARRRRGPPSPRSAPRTTKRRSPSTASGSSLPPRAPRPRCTRARSAASKKSCGSCERLRQRKRGRREPRQMLAEERSKTEGLGVRITELERQVVAQTTEAEISNAACRSLSRALDQQGRFLADREFASDRLHAEAAKAKTGGSRAARRAGGDADGRHRAATETIRAERASLEEQLNHSEEERAKLQREIAAMKHEAENTWATERMENALLRERINDVAAEVARLTATLEGPASPIASILADETSRSAKI